MTVRNRQLNTHMRVAGMNPMQAERFERDRLIALSAIESNRDRVRSVNWLK